jgi:hypothetical protein
MNAYRISSKIQVTDWYEMVNQFNGQIILNPVQDINGNLYISVIEYDYLKDIIKAKFGDKASEMVYYDTFVPRISPI